MINTTRVNPSLSPLPRALNNLVNRPSSTPAASTDSFMRSDSVADGLHRLQGLNSVGGKRAFVWDADKSLWHCHWFPMRATNDHGGDTTNNLYARGGALEKYDAAFGRNSRQHELEHNSIAYSDTQNGWFGHCNNAAEISILLQEPKKGVYYKGQYFEPQEIAGLCCKISDNLAERVDFRGRRYNGPSDDPNDPAPHIFLKTLIEWSKDKQAFVMDITNTEQVWNYPYDHIEINEMASRDPSMRNVKYYDAQLSGTGYEKESRHYQFWIAFNEDGSVKNSAWINGGGLDKNPDFLWRPIPVGDLNDGRNWTGTSGSNPYIRASEVFELYKRSIA